MKNTIKKKFCLECERETNHKSLKAIMTTESIESKRGNKLIEYEYHIVQCQGCDYISFVRLEGSEDDLDQDGNRIYEIYEFPEDDYYDDPRFLSENYINMLPPGVKKPYIEVSDAIDVNQSILPAVGLGMIIEAVCNDQGIKGKNLHERIIKLFEEGYIAKKDLAILDKLRQIRNTSAHKVTSPTAKTLFGALEVINHTLKTIYIIPKIDKYFLSTEIR